MFYFPKMNLILPVLKVFQQVETVLVTPKVLEARTSPNISNKMIQNRNFSSRSILIENKEPTVLAVTVPCTDDEFPYC